MDEHRITIEEIEPLVPFSRGSTEVFHTGHWSSRKPSWRELTSPCRQACPIGNDIARAFLSASRGEIDEALKIFREDNPFPGVCGRVCYHPCESYCNRKDLDEAVNIRGFERFLSDHGRVSVERVPEKKEKVAIVGSGPAGLSAAYHLARSGYPVTVFEALPEAGGMLMYGIPEYRLPKEVLRREVGYITRLGVEIKTGTRVGKEISFSEVTKDYQAVFLSVGAHKGASLEGVIDGIGFLRSVNGGKRTVLAENVAVIGGGNTSVDCARTARRLGAGEVTLVYRRSRSEMPALAEDVESLEREGIRMEFLVAPKRIVEGGIECVRTQPGPPDESGRRQPIPIQNSEFTIPADTVIAAVGQVPETAFLSGSGVTVDRQGLICASSSGSTGVKGVFAGGDAAGGRAFVADAIADGKKGALAIRCYLEGKDVNDEYERRRIGQGSSFSFEPKNGADLTGIVTFDKLNTICVPYAVRNNNPSPSNKDTTGTFDEVIGGLDRTQAEKEIVRCMACGTCTQCDLCFLICPDISVVKAQTGYSVKADYCKGCGVCASTCPRHAIAMGSASLDGGAE